MPQTLPAVELSDCARDIQSLEQKGSVLSEVPYELASPPSPGGLSCLKKYLTEERLRISDGFHVLCPRKIQRVVPTRAARNPSDLGFVEEQPGLCHSDGNDRDDIGRIDPSCASCLHDLVNTVTRWIGLGVPMHKHEIGIGLLIEDKAKASLDRSSRPVEKSGVERGDLDLHVVFSAQTFQMIG
jgi:hypothetical protein